MHTPPISADSVKKSTTISTQYSAKWNLNPNRSRMAAARVCLLTAASRPDISTRNITQIVPNARGQISAKPKLAPASEDVAMDPTSKKPPTLVTIPSAISRTFFTSPSRLGDKALSGPLPQWSVVSGQWSVVGGQWSVVSGQWSVVSGQWSVVSGQWSVVSGQWSVVSGQCLPATTDHYWRV